MRKTSGFNLKIIVIFIVLCFLIVGGLLFLQKWEDSKSKFPEQQIEDPIFLYEGMEYSPKNNIETFLVIGLDKYNSVHIDSYNNDKQADFLMLFVFDNDSQKYSAIHINRDTMVDINVLGVAGNKVGTVNRQIALAHTYGNGKDLSCHNTADSVSSLLMGIKVNHYASLTMDAVIAINDLVGGVEVSVLDDFTGIDDTLVKGEKVTLVGEQALVYVRSRKGLEDSTNNSRMNRQQQYISALYDAFNSCIENDDEFIVEASLTLSNYMISDRSVTQLQVLAEKFGNYEFLGIENIEGRTVIGNQFVEFYPDEDAVKKLVIKLFYEPKN